MGRRRSAMEEDGACPRATSSSMRDRRASRGLMRGCGVRRQVCTGWGRGQAGRGQPEPPAQVRNCRTASERRCAPVVGGTVRRCQKGSEIKKFHRY